MTAIPESDLSPERIRKSILDSYGAVYKTLIDEELRNRFQVTLDEYHHDKKLSPRILKKADEIFKNVPVNVFLIVAGFYKGSPIQFVVDGGLSVKVRPEIMPGNAVTGSGMDAALYWLNYRKQNIHFGLARSLFHLTEAKQFAETNPFVGQFREMVLLSTGSLDPLNWNNDAQQLVQSWWEKHGLLLSDSLEDESHSDAILKILGLS
jgi:hypothetical protein